MVFEPCSILFAFYLSGSKIIYLFKKKPPQMSFGIGIGDFISVIMLAKTTYQNCLSAPKEFHEAGREAQSISILLETIKSEFNTPNFPLLCQKDPANQFKILTENCRPALEGLNRIAGDFRSLGTKDPKILHRFRFPKGEIGALRSQLIFHNSSLSAFLNTVGLGKLGDIAQRQIESDMRGKRVEQKLDDEAAQVAEVHRKLDESAAERRQLIRAVHDIGSAIRSGEKEGTVLSVHTNDGQYSVL